jgi:NADPH-dependent ferric siderophore reductase
MKRVRLVSSAIAQLRPAPGQQIRLHVNDVFSVQTWLRGIGNAVRTYSIWSHDTEAGTIELCVLDHGGDSPGVTWLRSARPGQAVTFSGPEGQFGLDDNAGYHVFVGEETATVALGAMIRSVPPGAEMHGVLESDSAEDDLPVADSGRLNRVHRHGSPAHDSAILLDAVRNLELPAAPGTAYVAGEARTCQAVRAHLVNDRGWPRRSVLVKPFWTPGKRGME